MLKNLFISAGDASGDRHAAGVCAALKQRLPDIPITGVGDHWLAAEGVPLLADQTHMRQVGTIGLLKGIPFHRQLGKKILQHIAAVQPDIVVLIDYGGFHLRLAKAIRKELPDWRGKLVYFIPPQVWASRPYRINTLKQTVDHVLGILPFEAPFYTQHQMPYTFVGHPVSHGLPEPVERSVFCNNEFLKAEQPIVAIFPGSRRMELGYLLPIIEKAIPLIQAVWPLPVQFVLAETPGMPLTETCMAWRQRYPDLSIHTTQAVHALQSVADAAMVKSGTSTLETAWYGTPQVILYKGSWISYQAFKRLCLVPHIGLPNILYPPATGEAPVYLELLQHRLTPVALAQTLVNLLSQNHPLRLRQNEAHPALQALLQCEASPYVTAANCLIELGSGDI